MTSRILIGDCREWLAQLEPNSIDSCVTDPPYHLTSIVKRFGKPGAAAAKFGAKANATGAYERASRGFMGQTWDGGDVAFDPATWEAVWRVLKPGAHLIAFSGTRTYHRMACAIEDAGFEIRDQLAWAYGSGFPKSHDVSKAIDKAAGAEREVTPASPMLCGSAVGSISKNLRCDVCGKARASGDPCLCPRDSGPATPEAEQWQGWGTALKPAWEPILFGSKPLTVEQHFAVIIQELTARFAEIAVWLNLSAPDVAKRITAIQVKCDEAGHSVLDNAKIRSLESIGIAPLVAQGSTFSAPALNALTKTKGCSALSHVRQSGSAEPAREATTPLGEVGATLTRLMDMSTSVITGVMSESIVWSWLDISDAILAEANRFTIATATRLTTALKILSCSLRENTTSDTGSFAPNWEPICLARKPLAEKNIAANVLAHGTGAINVDGCRVAAPEGKTTGGRGASDGAVGWQPSVGYDASAGRWPANIIHDGSDEVLAAFPEASGAMAPVTGNEPTGHGFSGNVYGAPGQQGRQPSDRRDGGGSAARFFYCAKATTDERGEGNNHPTVKPIDLMRWCCRLITPPGGTIIDPFMGSGSTLIAADAEQFNAIGCELSPEYAAIAENRIRNSAGLFAQVQIECLAGAAA